MKLGYFKVGGVKSDKTVDAWGLPSTLTPPSDAAFSQFTVGDSMSCGRTMDGYVQCWGGFEDIAFEGIQTWKGGE